MVTRIILKGLKLHSPYKLYCTLYPIYGAFSPRDQQPYCITETKESICIEIEFNGSFPSCCLSRFRSESWCSTIEREFSLICIRIRNSFPFKWLCTRTRFETEACSNSEWAIPGGLVWHTIMAAIPLFWNTNMVVVTSCENVPYIRI